MLKYSLGALVGVVMLASGSVLLAQAIASDAGRLDELSAWAAYVTAVATGLLVLGATLGGVGVFRQIGETRASRESALRPVLVLFDDAWPEAPDGSPARLHIHNVGPGPALAVDIRVWVRGEITPALGGTDDIPSFVEREGREFVADDDYLGYPWPLSIPPGKWASVPIWRSGAGPPISVGPSNRLRYLIRYSDVFGNDFVEPPTSVGHAWVHDQKEEEALGDYSVRIR